MNSLVCLVPGCQSTAATGVVMGEAPSVRIGELRTLHLCRMHAGVLSFALVDDILAVIGREIVAQFPLCPDPATGKADPE